MPEEKLRQFAMARMTAQDYEWLRRMATEAGESVSESLRRLIQEEARRQGWMSDNGKEAK